MSRRPGGRPAGRGRPPAQVPLALAALLPRFVRMVEMARVSYS